MLGNPFARPTHVGFTIILTTTARRLFSVDLVFPGLSSTLLPFLFLGRGPLLKQTTEKGYP